MVQLGSTLHIPPYASRSPRIYRYRRNTAREMLRDVTGFEADRFQEFRNGSSHPNGAVCPLPPNESEAKQLARRLGWNTRRTTGYGRRHRYTPEVPQKAVLGGITKPFDPVGQYGNGGVVHRKSLNCPARIPHHDLVQREPLFRATDEEVSPEFRNLKHDARFPKQPRAGWSVVHDPSAPRYVPLETGEASLEKESEVTELKIGVEGKLLFALFVLRITREFVQDPDAGAHGEMRSFVLIPTCHLPGYYYVVGLACLFRVHEVGVGRCRCCGLILVGSGRTARLRRVLSWFNAGLGGYRFLLRT